MTPGLFFTSPRPAVVDLPHLITALDAELIAKVAHLTGTAPGLWRLPAPYDEEGVFDPWRDEETPFSLWSLPVNQAELLAPGRYAAEALFGTKAILLDSSIDEPAAAALADFKGERRDNGGFYVDGVQDLPALPRLIELTRWALIPVAPDRSHGLFVAAPAEAGWVNLLREWCERAGRSHCWLVAERSGLALADASAPEETRERAAASEIDQFIARMDRYFRLGDESLPTRVRDRLGAARRMEREVARAAGTQGDPA